MFLFVKEEQFDQKIAKNINLESFLFQMRTTNKCAFDSIKIYFENLIKNV
jgi:hypothetical protein